MNVISYLILGLILFGSTFLGNGLACLFENKNFKEGKPFYRTVFLIGGCSLFLGVILTAI